LVELVIADDSMGVASSPHATTFQRGFVACLSQAEEMMDWQP